MTNEQLKIILEQQAQLLEQAIEKSAELMPDDAQRSSNLIELMIDDKEKKTGPYLALLPIYEHLDLLRNHIKNLTLK